MTLHEQATLLMGLGGNWANQWLSFGAFECILKSGRKFRYQMQDYPFRVNATEAELDEVACRVHNQADFNRWRTFPFRVWLGVN